MTAKTRKKRSKHTSAASATAPASKSKQSAPNFATNDIERAARFVMKFGDDIRYVHRWKQWVQWNGVRWLRDDCDSILLKAQEMPKQFLREASLIDDSLARKAAARLAGVAGDNTKLKAMVILAQHQEGIAAPPGVFDSNPLLLGVLNGVVDLSTGTLRAGRKEDFITKQAGVKYDPAATCPQWRAFLAYVLDGNDELIAFIQRAVGYSLSGLTVEQALFFLFGGGRNGKSTFTEIVQRLMGDYGQRAPNSLFIADRSGKSAETEAARLSGVRFVIGSELEEGAKFAESRIKDLTGEDTIVARNLYERHVEFRPTHKIWIFGNHKPVVGGTDMGIWRRMKLIPFTVQIPADKVDRDLPKKLLEELPGILNWAIEGFLQWNALGLGASSAVTDATEAYREDEDVLGAFIAECCEDGGEVGLGVLYGIYELWAKAGGIKMPLTRNMLTRKLGERGLKNRSSNGLRYWTNLSLRCPAASAGPSELFAVKSGVSAEQCRNTALS